MLKLYTCINANIIYATGGSVRWGFAGHWHCTCYKGSLTPLHAFTEGIADPQRMHSMPCNLGGPQCAWGFWNGLQVHVQPCWPSFRPLSRFAARVWESWGLVPWLVCMAMCDGSPQSVQGVLHSLTAGARDRSWPLTAATTTTTTNHAHCILARHHRRRLL